MANIVYERLSHSIANVKTALNNIIPRFLNTTIGNDCIVETGSDGKIKGFIPSTSQVDPLPVAVTPSKGDWQKGLAKADHVHPNTCPDLTPASLDNEIANKGYVDNSISGLVSGVRLVGSGVQILLPKTQAAVGEVVKITGNDTYAVTTSGTTPDYAPIGVVASDILTGNVQWYAVSGLAYVSFTSPPTAGQIARLSKTGDPGAANGKATGVSVFSPPSASDDHWSEIGHVVSNVAVNGLYPVILHFN